MNLYCEKEHGKYYYMYTSNADMATPSSDSSDFGEDTLCNFRRALLTWLHVVISSAYPSPDISAPLPPVTWLVPRAFAALQIAARARVH